MICHALVERLDPGKDPNKRNQWLVESERMYEGIKGEHEETRSASVKASLASAEVKAAAAQVGDRNWKWGKKDLVSDYGGVYSLFVQPLRERAK
jgi:hypothetical protein